MNQFGNKWDICGVHCVGSGVTLGLGIDFEFGVVEREPHSAQPAAQGVRVFHSPLHLPL